MYSIDILAECLPVSVTNTKISNQKDTYFRNFHCHLWTVESGEYNQPNHATSSFCMAKSHQIAMFGSISVRQIIILAGQGAILGWLNHFLGQRPPSSFPSPSSGAPLDSASTSEWWSPPFRVTNSEGVHENFRSFHQKNVDFNEFHWW
jgi:hypothetical protein